MEGLPKKPIIIAAIVIAVLGIGTVGVLIWRAVASSGQDQTGTPNTSQGIQTKVVCKDGIITKADSLIVEASGNDTKAQQLYDVAADVAKLKDNTLDPNCLYILLSASIRQSDVAASRTQFDLLDAQIRSGSSFSGLFERSSPRIDSLRSDVQILEENQAGSATNDAVSDDFYQQLNESDKKNGNFNE